MDMESLISQTEALSWNDMNLQPAPETAKANSDKILIGRLVADQPLNKFAIHSSIKASWNFIKNFLIEDLEINKFIFTFRSIQDKLRVLNQVPWNFKGHLLIMKPWPLGATLQEISLNYAIFNVQIHGLPLDHITLENAIEIGKALGSLIKVEVDPLYGLTFRKYIRIKVEITKPLKQGFMMPRVGNHEVWVAFKYEKLSDICYACGRLGHSQIFCGYLSSPPTRLSYGPWLRAEFNNIPENIQSNQQSDSGQQEVTDHFEQFHPPASNADDYSKGKQVISPRKNYEITLGGQSNFTSVQIEKNAEKIPDEVQFLHSPSTHQSPNELAKGTTPTDSQALFNYSDQSQLILSPTSVNVITVQPTTAPCSFNTSLSQISLLSSSTEAD
ncbi:hypothetical protein F2P56_003812 [Juglans regia]|uniref:Uncharacterized protein LOC108982571 n=2 Tax=Juglans regia TaxID=51240 RepID=A0A2I4DQW0_JUGRE|nr:uncharacterized protein LOC108982571 [Juglans regia]KAF5477140.1 hypothetical protein F2P56_003812 [Juglans regia]